MKIGVGTTDGHAVCDHLARSSRFIVFEVEGGKVVARSERQRGEGACGNHGTFVEMLEGCNAVLCGGIGQGAVTSLTASGILPVVTAELLPIDEAVARYLAGTLATTDTRQCLCGPGH